MFNGLAEGVESYPLLFLACALSGLGVPLPEDVAVILAGIALAEGRFALEFTLPVVLAGVLTRDVIAWSLGRLLGDRLLGAAWFRRVVPPERLERARRLLVERGPATVAAGRFMVGFRVPIFLAAGAGRLPLRTFLFWDGLAALVAVPLGLALGATFGPPVLEIAQAVLRGSGVFWVVAATIAVLAMRARKKSRTGRTPA